jgi:thiol-disulfide isomerase/thioredoxin
MSRPGVLEELMTHSLITRRRLALMLTPVATALVLAGCASGNDTDTATEAVAPSAAASSPAAEASKDSSKKSDFNTPAAPSGYVSYSDYSKNKAQYDDADVVLFFNASWCSTCAEAEQQLSSEQFPDGLVVVSVDYDANEDLRQQYGVTVQHTFVQVNPDGSEVTKFSGATSVGEVSEQLA